MLLRGLWAVEHVLEQQHDLADDEDDDQVRRNQRARPEQHAPQGGPGGHGFRFGFGFV